MKRTVHEKITQYRFHSVVCTVLFYQVIRLKIVPAICTYKDFLKIVPAICTYKDFFKILVQSYYIF